MPSTSKAQQRFFAIAEHNPSELHGKMPNMTHEQLHDFAATPRTGLPNHVAGAQHPHANLGKFLHAPKAGGPKIRGAYQRHYGRVRPGK